MPDAKTLYAGALTNTHAAEHQGLVQMQGQLGRLDAYPEYKALVATHIETTRGQLTRIEAALAEAGSSASGVKEAVTSTAGTVGAAVHGLTGDPVLKDLYAGYDYQYDQIAAYRSLAVFAEAAGFPTAWIEQAVTEETRAAEAVAKVIEPVTRRYIQAAQA